MNYSQFMDYMKKNGTDGRKIRRSLETVYNQVKDENLSQIELGQIALVFRDYGRENHALKLSKVITGIRPNKYPHFSIEVQVMGTSNFSNTYFVDENKANEYFEKHCKKSRLVKWNNSRVGDIIHDNIKSPI